MAEPNRPQEQVDRTPQTKESGGSYKYLNAFGLATSFFVSVMVLPLVVGFIEAYLVKPDYLLSGDYGTMSADYGIKYPEYFADYGTKYPEYFLGLIIVLPVLITAFLWIVWPKMDRYRKYAPEIGATKLRYVFVMLPLMYIGILLATPEAGIDINPEYVEQVIRIYPETATTTSILLCMVFGTLVGLSISRMSKNKYIESITSGKTERAK